MAAGSAAGLDLLQNLGNLVASEIQPLRELVEQLVVRVGASENALKDKADSQVNMRIAQIEQTMQGKATVEDMKKLVERSLRLEQAFTTKADIEVHAKIANIEKGLQEKVMMLEGTFTRKLDQIIQEQTANFQQALDDMTSAEGMQQLSTRVVKDGLKGLESTLQDKVGHAQLMKLEDAVAQLLQQNNSNMEQIRQLEKLERGFNELTSSQIQLLETSLATVQLHVGQMEQAMAEKASTSDIVEKCTALDKHVQASTSAIVGKVIDLDTRMHDKVGADQMQKFEDFVKGIESRIQHAEQAFDDELGSGQLQQLEGSLLTFQMQIAGMQHSLEQKADVIQVQQVETSMEDIRSLQETIEAGMETKLTVAFSQQVKDSMTSLEAKLESLNQSLQGKVDCSSFHQSELSAEAAMKNVETRYASLENILQEIEAGLEAKVTTGFAEQVREPMTSLEAKMNSLDQSLQSKVDCSSFQQSELSAEAALKNVEKQYASLANTLQEIEAGLEAKVTIGFAEQVREPMTSLEAKLDSLNQSLQGKVDCGSFHLSELSAKAKLKNVETQYASLANTLQEIEAGLEAKVTTGFAEQVREPMTSLEAKLDSLNQSLQSKLDCGSFHLSELSAKAAMKNVETRYASLANTLQEIEAGLEAKVTIGFAEQVREPMTSLEAKLDSLNQSLQGKVDCSSFHQSELTVETMLKNIEAQYASLRQVESSIQVLDARLYSFELASKEKNETGESINALQVKIRQLDQQQMTPVLKTLQEKVGTEQFQQIESSVCSLVKKLTSMERVLQGKVGSEQLQHQSLILDGMQKKITSLETGLSARLTSDREHAPQQILAVERLEQLEHSMGAELTTIKRVLGHKADAQEVALLRASTQELLEPPVEFTDAGYNAPVSSPKLLVRGRATKRLRAEQ